ncbi:hypothetical protein R2601_03523 [Salipiger bermudensis HTCC2601]|uniref:Uncharacterized protein n=1 Tax=Salipiger bermudensis (strain DSM 26914 / JCM 13377 / KCTC 12554 / HTCC2601) TaxID=314265 RepID=Q0FWE1_SALBH|nr:hypothetical protein R2601_03523 [Salipiger bermudensis HTCC2601]
MTAPGCVRGWALNSRAGRRSTSAGPPSAPRTAT